MAVSIFNTPGSKPLPPKKRSRGKMRNATIREFGGGWNVIDAPAALSTRYASVLKNWYRKQDGSQALRYGTRYVANIAGINVSPRNAGTWLIANAGAQQAGDGVAGAKSIGFKFGNTNAGVIPRVQVEVTAVGTGGSFVAALYTNAAGSPGFQIGAASSALNITTTGVKIFTFPTPPAVAAALDYWIVITDQGTTADITLRTVADQGTGVSLASGKNDVITSIADNQLTTQQDWKVLVTTYTLTSGDIVDIHYFNGRIVAVTEAGEVATIDDLRNVEVIWNTAIAALETGSPAGWSTGIDLVSFTEIKGSLVICNGIDKPIEVQSNFDVRYLQDLATGSNVNVPVGFYCTTVSDYLCIAGVIGEPSVVYIGSKGTVGVFPGDAAPNDSLSLNLGAYSPEEGEDIRGISSFRKKLFVHFFSATVPVVLGTYDSTGLIHTPTPDDTLQKFGLLSHRVAVPVVNDLLFSDVSGANTVKRNVLSGDVEPARLSELIAPAYQQQVALLDPDTMLTDIFAVHDRLSGHYMIFVPDGAGVRTFVFTFNETKRIHAWSEFTGWTWRAATSSVLGRVFFAKDTRVYQYGNEAYEETFSGDLIGEFDGTWTNNTLYTTGDRELDPDTGDVYICLVTHTSTLAGTFAATRIATPSLWELYEGENINFDWEFPWTDANSRVKIKRLANLAFDSQGTSQFTVDVYVDNIYKDEFNDYDPALTLSYVGGDSPGYGGGDQPYGGGRRTTDARMWSHPVKFTIAKLRFHGATKKPLRIVSVTLLFAEGKYGR